MPPPALLSQEYKGEYDSSYEDKVKNKAGSMTPTVLLDIDIHITDLQYLATSRTLIISIGITLIITPIITLIITPIITLIITLVITLIITLIITLNITLVIKVHDHLEKVFPF